MMMVILLLYLPRVFMPWVDAASGLRTLGVPLTPFGRLRFPAGLGASSGMVMVFLDFYDESNRDSIF